MRSEQLKHYTNTLTVAYEYYSHFIICWYILYFENLYFLWRKMTQMLHTSDNLFWKFLHHATIWSGGVKFNLQLNALLTVSQEVVAHYFPALHFHLVPRCQESHSCGHDTRRMPRQRQSPQTRRKVCRLHMEARTAEHQKRGASHSLHVGPYLYYDSKNWNYYFLIMWA